MHKYFLEIKYRFFLLCFTWFTTLLVSYSFKEVLLYKIVCGASHHLISYFIFTDVIEVFSTWILLVFFVGNQVLVLFFFYHLLLFLLPGLSLFESYTFILIFLICNFLFFSSVLVFNKCIFCMSWDFFFSFKQFGRLSLALHFESKFFEYVLFYVKFYSACVFYFQSFLFPILFFIWVARKLTAYASLRKVLYFFCALLSTVITPPDVASQVFLSLCFIVSCEILIYNFTLKNVATWLSF